MSESRWIPVNEKLPSDCEDVIISYEEWDELNEDDLDLLQNYHGEHFGLWMALHTNERDNKLFIVYPKVTAACYFSGEPDEDGHKVKPGFTPLDMLDAKDFRLEGYPEHFKVIAWMPMPEPYTDKKQLYNS